jgi:hypothetical protein
MSLHVELSPEALERLRMQRRNSTISSFLVAFLSVVLIGLVLGFFLLNPMVKEPPVIVTIDRGTPIDDPPEPPKVRPSLERNPSSPSAFRNKVLISATISDVSIPVPDIDVATPSLDFGDGDDFGNMGGDSLGPGGDFIKIPPTMNKRCSPQDRLARLRETGGTPECEEAVVKALRWMKGTQRPDGSWGPQYPAAMTGLALLAYLGHCETPHSPEFGETVSKAIAYLVNIGLKNDGRLTSTGSMGGHQTVYEHGIATYALAEAYTLCKGFDITVPDLDVVTKKATEIIMDGQGDSGGWVYGYAPTNGGDNSVGFWQIQALKAAKHTGLIEDGKFTKVSRKALDFISSVQGPNGAVGYRNNPNVSPQLTGGAMLCFQMWDKGNAREVRKGMKYLMDNISFEWGTPSANLYYHYYHAQATMNEGGSEWRKYNNMFRDELLKAQNSDGSWTQSGIKHGPINQHMATCLATLMLEVYYRFLPGTGGKS